MAMKFFRKKESKINKKKVWGFIIAAVVVAAGLITFLVLKNNAVNENIVIATGNEGGYYYEYGNTIADTLKENGSTAEVKVTSGSVANIDLVSSGVAKVGIAQADDISADYEKLAEEEETASYSILGKAYDEVVQFVVSDASGIESIADLKNADKVYTISIGEAESGTNEIATKILDAALINEKYVKTEPDTLSLAVERIQAGEIDGFFFVGAAGTDAIASLPSGYHLVSFDEDLVEYVTRDTANQSVATIPNGTYDFQKKDIITIGIPAVIIVSSNISDTEKAAVVSAINDNYGELEVITFDNAVKTTSTTPKVELNMYFTLALSVACLALGVFLRKKINFLTKFCIPAPVVGGLVFAIISCILFSTGLLELSFDETLKTVCMNMFFTTVGFQANFKVLKSGGKGLIILLVCVTILIIFQNLIAVGLSGVLGESPLMGLTTGSIPMVGGHGTAASFGVVLEDLGLNSATTYATAAATFGLIAGSLMGGPLAGHLIKKKNLVTTAVSDADAEDVAEAETTTKDKVKSYASAAYQLAIAMGIGSLVSLLFKNWGITVPSYIGAMLIAAIMRNISEYSGLYETPMESIGDIGDITLSLFLGIAMITLKLWQLASVGVILIILLLGQTIFMFLFARFVVFNAMGRDYDAAVITAGVCGFGMGATPNAMANMQVVTDKYMPSAKAYLVVPLVGALFADFINSAILTAFINIVQ